MSVPKHAPLSTLWGFGLYLLFAVVAILQRWAVRYSVPLTANLLTADLEITSRLVVHSAIW
jgi:hypothetical protein